MLLLLLLRSHHTLTRLGYDGRLLGLLSSD